MNRPGLHRRRYGTSMAEVIVAIALLGTATVAIGRFAVMTKQGLRERELGTRLSNELLNARERIGAWPLEQITAEHIEELPFSKSLAEQVDDLKWRTIVESISEPVNALRVTLKLECSLHGQTAHPQALTFWVAP
ncbi:MAG: hypothetical protein KDA51_20340 [Planctomycetales bacterium]|nr:hypothetical protein [Planctomycetales bacterium]MCA9183828.1 hypothetical protein [Planctomycetales bacterium]